MSSLPRDFEKFPLDALEIPRGKAEWLANQGDEIPVSSTFRGPKMSWRVLDLLTHEATEFDARGGHFTSVYGHHYFVSVFAKDDGGVQKITLDGSGRFRSQTVPDAGGAGCEKTELLPASIRHQELSNPGVDLSLLVVMEPAIGYFDYFLLSCGNHYCGTYTQDMGAPGYREYFATSGLMTFFASSTNAAGLESSTSLTTSP